MSSAIQDLLAILDLEQLEVNLFRGTLEVENGEKILDGGGH